MTKTSEEEKDRTLNIVEFDICGQICPSTLLTALQRINEYSQQLSDGLLTLAFKTDNRDAINTIPESASNMGFKVTVTKKEGYYLLEVSGGE
jgi:TusA-related sulfurtransferase